MSPFSMKPRSLPSDLPLNDVAPLEKYIGTSGGYWKIYQSKLISSQLEVSVFLFDKTACNKHKQKKTILSNVWRHVDMIQNIQKYSDVTLKILLVAKENRRYIAYATEPVVGSLANVLGDYPNDICKAHASLLNKMSLCEMEIKYGVVAIAETLSYLHLYEAMIHCDVSPRNIVVCTNGCWRLSGFHFLMKAEAPHHMILNHDRPDAVTTDFLQPDINFAAPCLFLGTPTQESDIFSLGMLITYVYNNGISLIEGTAVLSSIYKTYAKEMVALYDERISSAYNAIKCRIPKGLQHGLSKMISFDVDTRPTAQQLLMLGYYHDPLIKYLKRLNLYENLSEVEKGVVLSAELPECAKNLPQALLLAHVMPILTLELEESNLCAGVINTLVICLRRTLSTTTTEKVCQLLNKVLDTTVAANLSFQSHEMLMSQTPLLFVKSTQISTLHSPMPVVMLGLADAAKAVSTLSAITGIVKYHSATTVLTNEVAEQVKRSLEQHWRQGSKDVCKQFLNAMLLWLSTLGEQSLSQDFICWFVELISRNLDILNMIRDIIMVMLANRDKYNLKENFIQKELSLAVENLITLPDLTNVQRHTLVQLARYTEKSPDGSGSPKQMKSKVISTSTAPAVDPRTASVRRTQTSLRRQSNTTAAPRDIRSQSLSPDQPAPTVIVSKPSDQKSSKPNKPDEQQSRSLQLPNDHLRRVSLDLPNQQQRAASLHLPDAAADRRRRLFQMDLSPSRSKNTSFGELMADIDDRSTVLTGGQRYPLLSRDSRARSLQTPSTKDTDETQDRRRPSLQPEHYYSLNVSTKPPAPSPQTMGDEAPISKIDTGFMKSILQRLDSLTTQLTSKAGLSFTENR